MRALLRSACIVLGLSLLAACETSPKFLLTYAAEGTAIQADRFVGRMLGKDALPLPYAGVYAPIDIAQPAARMRERFAELRARLDDGDIGLTEAGEVAVREASATPALRQLVREENADRAVFYNGLAIAVGHGGADERHAWLAYVRETFAAEWRTQAPASWWWRDDEQVWHQKD